MLGKKMSKNVKRTEERYKILCKKIKDVVVFFDGKGRIVDINPAVKRISGFSPKEIKGQHFKEIKFINPESKKRITGYFNKRLKSKKTPPYYEIEGIAKDGRRIIAEASITPLISRGKVIASLAIVRDITKRKQIEKMLRESEERLKNIISSSPDAITVTDLNGNITDCNKATLNMHGFSIKKELIGRDALDLISPKDRQKATENMKKTLKQGFIKNVEYTFLTKDSHEFPAELSASIIRDSAGKPAFFMAITKDISERKKVDQIKTEFVSLASHQLRTPLSIINWYAEMLLTDSVGKLNQDQKQYLNEVYHANQRMIRLTNTLLNVSRIELGAFTIKPKPTNLAKVVDSLLSEFSSKIKNKKLRVVKKYDKRLPNINVDPELIRVVFQNLLSNAVQYTPPRGRVGINIKKRKADILITIADTGYGIPKHQQHDVFTKMFRADNIIKKEPDGTGLGLYMAKYMVEQSGGKIWFKSEENKGTTFYVTIPLKSIKKEKGRKN